VALNIFFGGRPCCGQVLPVTLGLFGLWKISIANNIGIIELTQITYEYLKLIKGNR
jgi:hypothetical protein